MNVDRQPRQETRMSRPAPLELAAFIAASRPAWDRIEIQQAIDRARGHGWAYPHFVGAFWRTVCDDDAIPRDVDHMRPKTPPRPDTWI